MEGDRVSEFGGGGGGLAGGVEGARVIFTKNSNLKY